MLLVFVGHLMSRDVPFADWTDFLRGRGHAVLGVQLFFVLSGYLITSILLAELERTDRIAMGRFYLRRVRRLYPALVATCAALVGLSLATPFFPFRAAIADSLVALTYTANFVGTNWVGFTWSLSVEEQFYLTWPLVMLFAYRIGGRTAVGGVALALLVGTVILRHARAWDFHTIYCILRWDAPLAGCAIAALRIEARRLLWPAVIVTWYFALGRKFEFLSPEFYTLSTLSCAALVANAHRLRVLENVVLRHFGKISYGLYLWHCLIGNLGLPSPAILVLSIVVAELSWRYVEEPFTARARSQEALVDRRRALGVEGEIRPVSSS